MPAQARGRGGRGPGSHGYHGDSRRHYQMRWGQRNSTRNARPDDDVIPVLYAQPPEPGRPASYSRQPYLIAECELDVAKRDAMIDCPICCEPMAYVAAGKCRDFMCWICAAKLRRLQGDKSCPFCKIDLEVVLVLPSPFTRDDKESFMRRRKTTDGVLPAGEEDETLINKLQHINLDSAAYPPHLKNEEDGLLYGTDAVQRALQMLFENICWHPSCTRSFALGEYRQFKSPQEWLAHSRREHQAIPCTVCLDNRKIFLFEQLLFRPDDIQRHFTEGDRHSNPAIEPHVRCAACHRYCFDLESYVVHVKESHVSCYICDREALEAQPPFVSPAFPSFTELEQHYRQHHYPCPQCSYVAFRTDGELAVHTATTHGRGGRANIPSYDAGRDHYSTATRLPRHLDPVSPTRDTRRDYHSSRRQQQPQHSVTSFEETAVSTAQSRGAPAGRGSDVRLERNRIRRQRPVTSSRQAVNRRNEHRQTNVGELSAILPPPNVVTDVEEEATPALTQPESQHNQERQTYWARTSNSSLKLADLHVVLKSLDSVTLLLSEDERRSRITKQHEMLQRACNDYFDGENAASSGEAAYTLLLSFNENEADAATFMNKTITVLWEQQAVHHQRRREGRREPHRWRRWRKSYPRASPAADILVMVIMSYLTPLPLINALKLATSALENSHGNEDGEDHASRQRTQHRHHSNLSPHCAAAKAGDLDADAVRSQPYQQPGVALPISGHHTTSVSYPHLLPENLPVLPRPQAADIVSGEPQLLSATEAIEGTLAHVLSPHPGISEPNRIRSDSDIVTTIPLAEAGLPIDKSITFLEAVKTALDAYVTLTEELLPSFELPPETLQDLKNASKGLVNPRGIEQFLSLRATYYLLTQQPTEMASRDWGRRCTTVFRMLSPKEIAFLRAYIRASETLLPQAVMREEFPELPTPSVPSLTSSLVGARLSQRSTATPAMHQARQAPPRQTTALKLAQGGGKVPKGILQSRSHFPSLGDAETTTPLTTNNKQSWASLSTLKRTSTAPQGKRQVEPSPFPASLADATLSSSSSSSRKPLPSALDFPALEFAEDSRRLAGASVRGASPIFCSACSYRNPGGRKECLLCGVQL